MVKRNIEKSHKACSSVTEDSTRILVGGSIGILDEHRQVVTKTFKPGDVIKCDNSKICFIEHLENTVTVECSKSFLLYWFIRNFDLSDIGSIVKISCTFLKIFLKNFNQTIWKFLKIQHDCCS